MIYSSKRFFISLSYLQEYVEDEEMPEKTSESSNEMCVVESRKYHNFSFLIRSAPVYNR